MVNFSGDWWVVDGLMVRWAEGLAKFNARIPSFFQQYGSHNFRKKLKGLWIGFWKKQLASNSWWVHCFDWWFWLLDWWVLITCVKIHYHFTTGTCFFQASNISLPFFSVGIFENMCFKPKDLLREAQINDCQKRRFAKRKIIAFPKSKLETRNWMVCEGASSSYRCYILEGIMFQVPAANRSLSSSCFGVCIYI